jgi:plasmid stabilization system protein ParE
MRYEINRDAQRSIDDLVDYIERLEKAKDALEDQVRDLRKDCESYKAERDQYLADCDELTNANEALHNLYDNPKESTKVILM